MQCIDHRHSGITLTASAPTSTQRTRTAHCTCLLAHTMQPASRCQASASPVILQGQGLPGTAVQWGAWGGQGMAVRTPGFMERMARMGLGIVQPFQGVAVLSQLLQAAWAPLGRPMAQHALHVGEPDRCCALWGLVPGILAAHKRAGCPSLVGYT